MFCRDSAPRIIVLFVVIQQILLPLQETFFSFTWDNKETIFFFLHPNTVLEAGAARVNTQTAMQPTRSIFILSWACIFLCVCNEQDGRGKKEEKKKRHVPFPPAAISRLDWKLSCLLRATNIVGKSLKAASWRNGITSLQPRNTLKAFLLCASNPLFSLILMHCIVQDPTF